MKRYPLFVPPIPLAVKRSRQWSDAEAEEYFGWLTGTYRSRVKQLLEYFGESSSFKPDEACTVLKNITRKTAEALPTPAFSEKATGESKLTNAGAALAGDTGLLIAQCLIDLPNSTVEWRLIKDPPDDVCYNRPTLVGFDRDLYFDPVGGSVIQARAFLGLNKTFSPLVTFEHWSQLAVGPVSRRSDSGHP